MKNIHDVSPEPLAPPKDATGHPARGILDRRTLPDQAFDAQWEAVIVDAQIKNRLLAQAVLNFTARHQLQRVALPMHGIILLVGPPGTGKTSLSRGLASRTAASLDATMSYLEVEPHALACAALGKSQQAVRHLLGDVIAEHADSEPCIVLLDEVETLAAARSKMSLEANPVDVHRATDAVLAQVDQLSVSHPNLLFIATSNFVGAVDQAFLSRSDLLMTIGLPGPEACRAILLDTIERLSTAFPAIKHLCDDPAILQAGNACAGLDGRRIRKVVLSALAHDKVIAADPSKLTPAAIEAEVEHAQAGLARMGVTQ